MAVKIKLGARPKNFKPFTVKFTMPDGDEGMIEVTYKYRTRIEFGQMIDAAAKDAGEDYPATEKGDFDKFYQRLYEKMGDKNADHLLSSIDSWNLDVELSRESLVQLSNEVPSAVIALMASYRDACIEGRLGN